MAEASSSSTSAFVSALIIYGIIGAALFIAFTFLRPKQPAVYQPKTKDIPNRSKDEQPPEVSKGLTAWLTELWQRPQSFFIQYIGIDGYLYTRYVGIFAGVSFIGALILLPILLPVNATNGNNYKGFELLSFANVTNNKRYYAHVFLSWIFYGLVIWVIYKELVFYTTFRHSLQTTPLYDELLSSRTLLITDIPENLETEAELRQVFPFASRIWYARDNTELSKLIDERTKLSNKYEASLNKIVKKSTKYHKKLVKKSQKIPETPEGLIEKQPTHKLGKIPFIGEKVETIDYSIKKLPELDAKIEDLQSQPEIQEQIGSVFIEFPTQLEAQRAYQSIKYQKIFTGHYVIGVAPADIIWKNLTLRRKERTIKKILSNTFLTLLIIFWAIPVAVVGCISNITFLTEKIHFLRFINNCPDVILGLITGILPTVALAILMSFVPVIIKKIGQLSGLPTHQAIDLYCQSWYYGFQVIQVFLVVTLASSASSTVTAIINDPSSAMTLLAQNLPKASNFYISYFLLQGLYTPAWTILQAVPLALAHALAFLLGTPRKKWTKTFTLAAPSYGVIYPPLQLLILLYIVYAIIAPILLVFSTFAIALSYFVNLYLFTYVKGYGEFDQRGRNYSKALYQTFVALYIAEVCVLGLFIMAKTWGPVALEAIVLAVTVLAHLYLRYKFENLFDIVPISGINEFRDNGKGVYPTDHGLKEIKEVGQNYLSESGTTDINAGNQADDAATYQSNKDAIAGKVENPNNDSNSSRNETIQGGASAVADTTGVATTKATVEGEGTSAPPELQKEEPTQIGNEKTIGQFTKDLRHSPKQIISRFINPEKGYTFKNLHTLLPAYFNYAPVYTEEFLKKAYYDPILSEEKPKIWIPRDIHGVSTYEIEKAAGKVEVYDDGAELSEDGKLTVTGNPPGYQNTIKV